MRQDKDRSGKWLLTHHGDAILKLGGITDFSSWKALQPETVAPRRLPDGLIEVRFPGESEQPLYSSRSRLTRTRTSIGSCSTI